MLDLFPLVLHSGPWFGVVRQTMDTNILRLTGRIALLFVRAGAFGLRNESKGLSQGAPLLPGGGESASWRSLAQVGFGWVKCVFTLVRRCSVMSSFGQICYPGWCPALRVVQPLICPAGH